MEGAITDVQLMPDVTSRFDVMLSWVSSQLECEFEVSVLAKDASYRCYYRVTWGDQSRVIMDAPPEKEKIDAFVIIDKALNAVNVMVPEIYAANHALGFLLLADFGDDLYFKQLSLDNADYLYNQAFDSILLIQSCAGVEGYELPCFSAERLHTELQWFEQWYVIEYMQVLLSKTEQLVLSEMFSLIVEQALAQPQVLVHKDFHSRNLFVLEHGGVGVIDFQDALMGPIAYDVMSLMYDHYIAWPREKIVEWVGVFQQKLLATGRTDCEDFAQFLQWHDWLVLQRVMKNLGNFVRINVQQAKAEYLQDIPRIYQYILTIAKLYTELEPLAELLQQWQPAENVI